MMSTLDTKKTKETASSTHSKTSATLLINLGSPNSPAVKDVRVYLRQFLMDELVIDVPFLFRWIIVNLIILVFRPRKSAAAYKTIWTEEGSPLVVTSLKFGESVKKKSNIPVEMVMRYGNPSIESGLLLLNDQVESLEELFIIPMYPHYADSTWKTALEEVKSQLKKHKLAPRLKVIKPFYNHDTYIDLLSNSIKPYLNKPYDHILFSYHGLPERHLRKADPTGMVCLKQDKCCESTHPNVHATCYRAQTVKMTELISKQLKLNPNKFSICFQSRLGSDPWTTPNTEDELIRIAKEGKKRLLIVCPAFTVDCLETLEEICEEGKELFIESGGTSFTYIPCLNLNEGFIDLVSDWIKDYN